MKNVPEGPSSLDNFINDWTWGTFIQLLLSVLALTYSLLLCRKIEKTKK